MTLAQLGEQDGCDAGLGPPHLSTKRLYVPPRIHRLEADKAANLGVMDDLREALLLLQDAVPVGVEAATARLEQDLEELSAELRLWSTLLKVLLWPEDGPFHGDESPLSLGPASMFLTYNFSS